MGSQNQTAIVLGSGETRGIAHLRVLKVSEDSNITIDYICGSGLDL